MNAAIQSPLSTVEDYLAREEQSSIRHEYFGGVVYAMAGSSPEHNLLAGSVYSAFLTHLDGSRRRPFIGDIKVRLHASDTDTFYYPDVLVTCDATDCKDGHSRFPKLIVEVLSPSTEGIDRREKFWSYVRINSVEEYALIAQDRKEVTIFRRGNQWKPDVYNSDEEKVHFRSINLILSVHDIYRRVQV